MTYDIPVECLVERFWDVSTRKWNGELVSGTLIDVSTQTTEEKPDKLITVGIVLLEDNTFQCIPMEFICKKILN